MLKVVTPGVYASVQDLGRFGYANVGVPVAGAMDQNAAKLANLILHNTIDDAIVEITLGGSSFQFLKETIISICGADLNATINAAKVLCNHPIKVKKDSVLIFKKPVYGTRAYLAVKGGFLNKKVLNSRSFFKEVTKKYVLKKDDEILYDEYKVPDNQLFSSVKVNQEHFLNTKLEVYEGPEFTLLGNIQKGQLENIEFTISKDNNRMGFKLKEGIENKLKSILTSAVMPGTVQLTPSGKLIVLMRDCQVTGGYPRVLQLTENAINCLAQKSENDTFNFKTVDL
jgi:biotin-dependent carboxylase-like uncharacterized protein